MLLKPAIALVLVIAGAAFFAHRSQQSTATEMLGGFHPSGGAENDARVQKAAEFAVAELSAKTGSKLTLSKVLSAETQVVAGTNFRLKLEAAEDTGAAQTGAAKTFSATVYESLPHAGGKMELSEYKELGTGESTSGSNGASQQAAEFAARHISQASNSLVPLVLREVVEAKREGNEHSMTLRMGREGLPDSTWNVVVEEGAGNDYTVKSADALP